MSANKLFCKTTINPPRVAQILEQHWEMKLGDLIKASQNHTFKAADKQGAPCVVRVVPEDKEEKELERITSEVQFLKYLDENGLSVCCAVPTVQGELFVYDREEKIYITVTRFAKGNAINSLSVEWMNDKKLVYDWGRWMGKFHNLCRKYVKEYPERYQKVREWTTLHDNIMDGAEVSKEDEALARDPAHFGLTHGDVNSGNLHYDPALNTLWVFDWDQIQKSWYMYDLAQSIFGPWMLSSAGSPVDGSPLPCDVHAYYGWMVEGYDSTSEVKVDDDALKRMLKLRLNFYERFCRRAIVELEGDAELAGMRHFCNYVVKWVDTNPQF